MFLLGSLAADLLAAIAVLFVVIYFWWTAPYDYWKKRNIPNIQPSFPFGNLRRPLLQKSTLDECDSFYRKFKTVGYGGIFNVRTPVLIACKPEFIKQVLTKDFNAFHDRGNPHDEEKDPFGATVFSLEGQRWKIVRAKLTPTFTTGKIRGMFPLIYDCTQNFKECLQTQIKTKSSLDLTNMLCRFATDVISTCAFGVDCNSLKNPNTEVLRLSQEIFQANTKNMVRSVLIGLFPNLVRYLTFDRCFPKSATFFTHLMDTTIKYRREKRVERNDFVKLMLEIVDEDAKTFSQQTMTSQALLFFIAGLDNIANTLGFCLHELAVNPELQERVYQEIQAVLQENDGQNSYEALQKMDLVKRVADESLRKYPIIGLLMRCQTEGTYKIPGTDDEVGKGARLWVPVKALHHDEEIYPNPEKFDPDRFTEEEKNKRHPYSYLPFGEGPRSCIASRFALMEIRLSLVELIRQFEFSVAPETDLSLEQDPISFELSPKRGFWLSVAEREKL